jgi:CDP-diacylglycerol--serine O-phosphatidyltransferase
MVSRLPVFSGKQFGKRVAPEMVLPIFVVAVLFFALLISYPWQVLSAGTFAYLACLPLGYVSYRNYQRKDAEAGAAPAGPASAVVDESGAVSGEPPHPAGDDRPPSRLN